MKTLILAIGLLLSCLATAHGQPAFTDVTTQAGVANSLSGSQQRLATNLAWGDYDGDGDLDLYVANWGSSVSPVVAVNRLYRNNGNGSFSDIAQTAGVADSRNSIAANWIDYDNDGHLDLYVVNFSEQDQLYRNGGSGTFSRVTGAAGVNVISQGSETTAAWGDYDGDGDLDYYLCKLYFKNSLYRNNGSGSFTEVSSTSGVDDIRNSVSAAWGDYDGDGDLDLYVVNREQNNALYRTEGTGAFSEVACALSVDNTDVGQSANWVDYDGDGDLDLYLANIGADALYRNDGNDIFVNVAQGDLRSVSGSWISWAGSWGDFDLDGVADVFVANGSDSKAGQVSHLLLGSAVGSFADVTSASGLSTAASSTRAAAAADYDGDGDLDLYVLNSRFPSFEASKLYRNDTAAGTAMRVNVLRSGTGESSADGIGTSVTLLLGDAVMGAYHLSSGPDARQALFVGQMGQTYSISVNFPGGSIVTAYGLTPGSLTAVYKHATGSVVTFSDGTTTSSTSGTDGSVITVNQP